MNEENQAERPVFHVRRFGNDIFDWDLTGDGIIKRQIIGKEVE